MLRWRLIAVLAVSVHWLSACGPATAFPPPAPSPVSTWSLRLTQTGGFAGVHLEMELSSDGHLAARDERSGRTASQQLPEDVVRQISHLLADARLGQNQPLPSMCADCFIYRLEITATNGSVIVQADDSNLNESGAAELIDALRQVRDQALSSAS